MKIIKIFTLILLSKITYANENYTFISEGISEFEYICSKPVNTMDCRTENLDHLKDIEIDNFILSEHDSKHYKLDFIENELSFFINKNKFDYNLNKNNFYTDNGKLEQTLSLKSKLIFEQNIIPYHIKFDITKYPIKLGLCENNNIVFGCKKDIYMNGEIFVKRYISHNNKILVEYLYEKETYYMDSILFKEVILNTNKKG